MTATARGGGRRRGTVAAARDRRQRLCAPARQIRSPNRDAGPGTAVTLIVVHGISLPPGEFGGEGIIQLFTNRLDPRRHPYYASIASLKVSAHFLIRRDGELVQFVGCNDRAWHAGESEWKGRSAVQRFLDRYRARGHRRRSLCRGAVHDAGAAGACAAPRLPDRRCRGPQRCRARRERPIRARPSTGRACADCWPRAPR